jgi:hypothetical protein
VTTAATRYTTPGGPSAGDCLSEATACDVEFAIESAAQAGDEVVVLPGTYSFTSGDGILIDKRLDVHGKFGAARPVLAASDGPTTVLRVQGGAGTTVRNLKITQDATTSAAGYALSTQGPAVLRQLVVRNDRPGESSHGVLLHDGAVLTDSFVIAKGLHSNGVEVQGGGSVSLRNVTTVAYEGGSYGLSVRASCPPPGPPCAAIEQSVDAANVIAFGAGNPANDILISNNTTGGSSTLHIRYSNWGGSAGGGSGTIDDQGNNSFAQPQFVDLAAGDLHQLPTSPTVNAGVADPLNGPVDVDGDDRVHGGAPDVGADELPTDAPSASTGAADGVSTAGATLRGAVDSRDVATTWFFQYGTTTAYGQRTEPQTTSGGHGPAPVATALDALAPGTTFHYRLVAQSPNGMSVADDQSFTTATPPSTQPPPTQQPPPAQPPPALPPPLVDLAKPVLVGLAVTPSRFRVGRRDTALTAAGARVAYRLSEPASVRIDIARLTSGRRSGNRCVAQTRKNARAKGCTLALRVATLTRFGRTGANSIGFSGRFEGDALPPARYRLTATPTDTAGNVGRTATALFRVLR